MLDAFAKHIASLGYTAQAFDFSGFGSSKGEFNFDKTTDDVVVVIDHLYARGYERIVCMGASVGGARLRVTQQPKYSSTWMLWHSLKLIIRPCVLY